MLRTAFGCILAAILIFFWGFIYWGLGPYPSLIWKQVADHEAASRALREHFPERGTYFLPGPVDDAKEHEARFERGPVAMVHMVHPQGHAMFDPSVMGQGFVLNLVVVILVAVLLHNLALPTYLGRVAMVTLVGIAASLLIDGGDVVWWQISWEWKLYQAVYDVSVWVLAGLVLAALVKPRAAPPAPVAH